MKIAQAIHLSDHVHLHDSTGKRRFFLNTTESKISYYNSKEQHVFTQQINRNALEMMARKMFFSTAACPAEITVDRNTLYVKGYSTCAPETHSLTIVKMTCNDDLCHFYNTSSKPDLKLYLSTDASAYKISPASLPNSLTKKVTLSLENRNMLKSYGNFAESSCPLKISYQVDTMEIKSVQLECDPLVSSGEEVPRGE